MPHGTEFGTESVVFRAKRCRIWTFEQAAAIRCPCRNVFFAKALQQSARLQRVFGVQAYGTEGYWFEPSGVYFLFDV